MSIEKKYAGKMEKRSWLFFLVFFAMLFINIIFYIIYLNYFAFDYQNFTTELVLNIKHNIIAFSILFTSVVVLLNIFVILMIINFALKSRNQLLRRKNELEKLTEGISSGLVKFAYDDGFELLYANTAFFNLHRYSRKDYLVKFGKNALACIHPADYIGFKNEFEKQKNRDELTLEYRSVDNNNKIHWLLIHCIKQTAMSQKMVYQCVITDICHLKKIEEELVLNNSRLRAVLEQSKDVVFEYDFTSKLLKGVANWIDDNAYSYEFVIAELIRKEVMNEESLYNIIDLINNCREGFTHQKMQFLLNYEGLKKWHELQLTTIFNHNNEPRLCVGRLFDIDNQIKEKEFLIEQSRKESMTGLYNKKIGQDLVERYLSQHENPTGALFMIDIDDFKKVNDTYGHIVGDQVIVHIASVLKQLFRNEDIVARIGGDEFLVFMRGCSNEALVSAKAEDVMKATQGFKMAEQEVKISVSIGIAFAPIHGRTCVELIEKADSMMYFGKRNGKGHYELYS